MGKTRGENGMKNKIRLMCISGVLVALVFVVTAYLHIPTNNGYVHIGDGFIYLAACLLPWPYAVFVGAGGALLADVLAGFAVWAPGSVLIKSVTALLFSSKGKKIMTLRNALALLPAAAICAGGYYLYEALLYSNFISPLAGIPANLTQSVASAAVFVVSGLVIDRTNLRQRMNGELKP